MGTEGSRTRSHAHGRRYGRYTVHSVVVLIATLSVTFAAQYPSPSSSAPNPEVPSFSLSGVTGLQEFNPNTYIRPRSTFETRDSITVFSTRSNVGSLRAAGAISPTSSFSAGVSAATASSGEVDAGIKPLADMVDPREPFLLHDVRPGDTASSVAAMYNIALDTLLTNNETVTDKDLLQQGQQLIVPRKDGILYKVALGDTVASIVDQYDNITADQVTDYRPNAITDPANLEAGRYLLLIGAKLKPPPPPPPPPPAVPAPAPGDGGGSPPPSSGGRFSLPLSRWLRVSDWFGTPRGGGTYHTGIDLDLYGMWASPVYSACDGVVTRTEWLTYSYGYYVVVDCGDGWTTLYAHFSYIGVSVGQYVSQGTQLGRSGSTGFSTGEHLHFEIRLWGAPVDPAAYLPFY